MADITFTDEQVDALRRVLNLTPSATLAAALHNSAEWESFTQGRSLVNAAATDPVRAESHTRDVARHREAHHSLRVELDERG